VPGERVQRRERLTACNFLPKFLVAEIFRLALESAYPTSGLPDLQQRIELVIDLRRERAVEKTSEAFTFASDYSAYHVLQKGVGQSDEVLMIQIL
jgi:hypothetical protein